MASRRTLLPLLLLAFALVAAGGLMEGVRGALGGSSSMSSVRRRLAGHPLGARAASATVHAEHCPIKCDTEQFPTCCLFSLLHEEFFFCAATGTDFFNCGGCGKQCKKGDFCCDGVCRSLWFFRTEHHHCGFCGNQCAKGVDCVNGACGYTAPGHKPVHKGH